MSAALVIAQFVLQYGFPAALRLIELSRKPDPTLADWQALFEIADKKSYDDYIAGPTVPKP